MTSVEEMVALNWVARQQHKTYGEFMSTLDRNRIPEYIKAFHAAKAEEDRLLSIRMGHDPSSSPKKNK